MRGHPGRGIAIDAEELVFEQDLFRPEAPVSETETRQRLAAILMADVAGYSRLMSGDEAGTVAALDTARAVFRTTIDAQRGRVIDMAGDSVLAIFETASGAVASALAIQAELGRRSAEVAAERRMQFRIGVHLGDVIEKSDGTIYGDGVNIAARLESIAEPGGVTVSDAVQCAIRQRMSATFEDLGEQRVKNIPEPVRCLPRPRFGGAGAKAAVAGGDGRAPTGSTSRRSPSCRSTT